MSWRQYDTLFGDIKNVAYKATLAPFVRMMNASASLNRTGLFSRRIVICGCPRSGTTLMNELMRCFDGVDVMTREEYALRYPYLSFGNDYVVTKHPLDYRNLDRIRDTYVDPLIIFMLRDPRDVIISKHYKNNDKYLITYPTWQESVEAFEAFDYENMIMIRFEDLTAAPEQHQSMIAERFGLSTSTDFQQFEQNITKGHQDIKSLGGIRPIDPANSGKFMRPEHHDRIREELAAYPQMIDQLIRYGYEPDDSWAQQFRA